MQIDIVKAGGETKRFFKNTMSASAAVATFDLYKEQPIEVIVTPQGWEDKGYYPQQRAFVKTLTWEEAKAGASDGKYTWVADVGVIFVKEKPDWIKLWE